MKKTLFEMLAIADQERIHTQVIAWLLTYGSSPLSTTDQARLINHLFNVDLPVDEIKNIKIITELNNLDLAIIHKKAFIVIENKLKSKQRKDQLKRYSTEIQNLKDTSTFDISAEPIKFFLTFSGELSDQEDWRSIDYKHIHESLVAIDSKENYIVDYIELLRKLISSRDDFLINHNNYKEIFRRSGMKAVNRLNNPLSTENENIKFICENKLERIFIETLFRKITNNCNLKKAEINESHGVALIHVDFFSFKALENPNHLFKVGYQIQGDSIKYVLMSLYDYQNSSKEDLPKHTISLLEFVFHNMGFKSNSAKSKAYHSWSKKISQSEMIENLTFDEFSSKLKTDLFDAEDFWKINLLKLEADRKISELAVIDM